jgi:hypothetical protein
MLATRSDVLSRLLNDTVAVLDLPEELREAATQEYQRVGNWLAAHADGANGWAVSPQGSFLLNTVVLPAGADEYDLDAVCLRCVAKESTTQARLKSEVGDVLMAYVRAHLGEADGPRHRKEGGRCWTLLYDSTLRFHMDVLPAIPNIEKPPTGLLITDRELREWQRSDPQAYAGWFRMRSEAEFVAKRRLLAEAAHTVPEAIPDWQVKTTLHRVVQVLKLHRNQFFERDADQRPASILLTTLAAHVYRGENDLAAAVLEAADLMPAHVHKAEDGWWVPNPVEPRENFADRWRKKPTLAERFFEWLDALRLDLRAAEAERGLDNVAIRLSESFGKQPVEKAMARLGDTYRQTRESGVLGFAPASGLLSTSGGIPVRNHDFYGA